MGILGFLRGKKAEENEWCRKLKESEDYTAYQEEWFLPNQFVFFFEIYEGDFIFF